MVFLKSKKILAEMSEDFTVKALASSSDQISPFISKALTKHQKWHKRNCPLKPNLIVWLVMFLSVYRGLSIPGVFRVLLNFMRELEPELDFKTVTPEALCHAKARLGSAPMKELFTSLATSPSSRTELYQGLRLFGIDGTHFRTPDSKANDEAFGRQISQGKTVAGYPHFLSAVLVEAFTHKVVDIECGKWNSNERALTQTIISRSLGTGDLVLMDRGVSSFGIFLDFKEVDCDFLARIPKSWKVKVLKPLGPGDCLVKIIPSSKERARLKKLGKSCNKGMILRMLTYHLPGYGTVRLLTTLLDKKRHPAVKLSSLYNQRWEAEIAFDEIKNHFLGTMTGKQPTHFRSKTPDGIRQEMYGMLISYNLTRELMNQAAQEHKLKPLQLSFVETLETLKLWLPILERSQNLELDFSRLLHDISQCRLRKRRPRSCPRKVKVAKARYDKKKTDDHEQKNPTSNEVMMGAAA